MRLPRFTTRRLMVIMAILALAMFAEITRRRWTALAAVYYADAVELKRQAQWNAMWASQSERSPFHREEFVRRRRKADRYLAAAKQYERASRYPWLPVPPYPNWLD